MAAVTYLAAERHCQDRQLCCKLKLGHST